MLKTYEVKLDQATIDFIDGCLEGYAPAHPTLAEDIAEIRERLNSVLTCEAGECDSLREGLDTLCHHCGLVRDSARASWESHGRRETEQSKTYRQDMIDAGRGHLLGEGL